MAGKHWIWRLACVVLLGLLAPSAAPAGPYFGDWGWFWNPWSNCDWGVYSPLHYWAPGVYYIREYCRPSNVDSYSPGPTPTVLPSYETYKYCCPSTPAAPTSPYANPAGYYGREIAPPR
jgi:hypothetical protein